MELVMDEAGFNKELEGATRLITGLHINQESSNQAEPFASKGQNEDKARFNKLIGKAKELARRGQLERALHLFEKAYKIHESEKLWRKIEKLKEAVERYKEDDEEGDEEEEEDNGMHEVGDGFCLPAEMYQALYPYQLEGILWFWRLHKRGKGGILGDDMGLGKTIQVVCYLAGMFDAGLIKSALIVLPVSLLQNWETEFSKWAPGIRVKRFHGPNKNTRMKNLERVQRRSGVCLTTYGLMVSSHESLGKTSTGSTFTWDYIILDEGHKIKNTTKTSKNIREIPAKSHFILTGTPVQNNLREMWALFDFVCEGRLLGTSRTFKQQYEDPIVRARERDASAYEKRVGSEMSDSLRKLIEPHFLRRTKAMVLETKKQQTDHEDVDGPAESDKENRPENQVRMPEKLTRKNDLIIWLYMSETQQKIYSDFLGLERVKEILMSTRSPLAELNVLKKICDHPRLLSTLACEQLGLDEEARQVELDSSDGDIDARPSFATQPKGTGPSDRVLTQESGKMVFLVSLLDNLKSEGHRCLVFSQSRKMLDIIQRVITHVGHKVLRIDGTIAKTADRQHLIDTFQSDPSYSCFLLTTQVGGVGITLTAADRVVIFDPSWNPATDAQAVDRVYRIGQKKTVIIYRLITCSTLEEKIYRKQIFKDALMKQTTGVSKNPFRYFTNGELRDLFTLDDPYTSKTQMQLERMHSHHRKTDETLDRHIAFIHSLNIFGISDHDLMYSQEAVETIDELNSEPDTGAIQARVLRAQNLVAAEAEARQSGQIRPGGAYPLAGMASAAGAYPPAGIPPGAMALPQGLRHSLPVNESSLSARQKIQAKIDSERFIVPQREDTKRFHPARQLVKAPIGPSPEVVDLCSPGPLQYPVEINRHTVDEQLQGDALSRRTPLSTPVDNGPTVVDLCSPSPMHNSTVQSPVDCTPEPGIKSTLQSPVECTPEPIHNSTVQYPVERTPEPVQNSPVQYPVERTPEPVQNSTVLYPVECTPEPVRNSPVQYPVERCPEPVRNSTVQYPVECTVDEQHQGEVLARTPSPAPVHSSSNKSPVEISHLLLAQLLAQDEHHQGEGLEQTPSQAPVHSYSNKSPVEISHLSLAELLAQEEQDKGEELEEEFASLRIENHNISSDHGLPSSLETTPNTSHEKQTLEECSHLSDKESTECYQRLPCPTGEHVSEHVKIHKCACLVREEEKEKYQLCIKNGRRFVKVGKTKEALMQYLNALEIQDSDLKLHLKALKLGRALGFQSVN